MSDSTEDRRHRGRRGSLLDHARDAQPGAAEPAREPADGQVRESRHSAPPASSLLTTRARSARISTSPLAESRDPVSARPRESLLASGSVDRDAPAAAERPSLDPVKPVSSGREKFGDRIARLIGTIAPEDKPAEPKPAAENNEPADSAAEQHARSRPDAFPRHPAEHNQPSFPYDGSRGDRFPHDDHYHWHTTSAGGRYEDGGRPLLDASILISAVWRFRRLIGVATVAGAVLGVLLALSTPHRYYAESRLFVDPREIRLTEDDARNPQLSTEAMLAITDSQLQILSSTSVLEKVIVNLGLDRDPEFNGSLSSGGISGGLSLIKELFTGKNGATEVEQKTLNNLRHALSVARDAKTFVIILGVDTRDPDKSALIANQIVETYLDSEGQAQSSLLERTSESIDTRVSSLRSDLDAAEREVERFKAENGLVGVGGQYIDDKVILALSDQLANARAMKVGIRIKASNLAKVNIDDVLSGAFPEELLSSNLSELRKQFTQTKSNAESLATSLGPRHPQYIAAMQSLETITNEISAELRRIVASSQTELQRAVETEQELASQMAVAKSRAIDQSVELVSLRELERKANATRGIYEGFLTRSRETSERSNLSTRNVRVISPAEAPLLPMGPSRKIIAIGGMVAGLFAGLGLALLAGAVESIRAYNGALPQARFQGGPSWGYPEPPEPGPRTPPNGPGHRSWSRRNEDMPARDAFGDEAKPFSGARAQSHEKSGDDESAEAEPTRVEPAIAKSSRPEPARPERARVKTAPAQQQTAPSRQEPAQPVPVWPQAAAPVAVDAGHHPVSADMIQRQPQAPASYPQAPAAHPGYETARNAQAFLSGHEQPQRHMPIQTPMATTPDGQAPRMSQPHWTAYPAQPSPHPQAQYQPQFQPQFQPMHPSQPPYQHHPQPAHPPHPGYVAAPYAPVHPAYNAGYVADTAGLAAPAPAYPVPQPQMIPVQPHQFPPQAYPAYPPVGQGQPVSQPVTAPVQPYAAAYPMPPVYPSHAQVAPVQVWPQQAPQAPLAVQTPVQPEQPVRPDNHEAVDRIRREMDLLRSRIDGYGPERRRA